MGTADFYELFMQMELHFFYLSLPAYRTRNLLWLLLIPAYMINRSYHYILSHGDRIFRICPTMRPNVFLRGYRNYKSSFGDSLRRNRSSTMAMRRVCSRQCYANAFFYIPFLISVYCCSCCNSTLIIFASNRVKQPSRITKQYR